MPSQTLALSLHCCLFLPSTGGSIQFGASPFSLGSSLDSLCSALTSPWGSGFISTDSVPGLEQGSPSESQQLQHSWLCPAQRTQHPPLIYLSIYFSSFLWLFAFQVLPSAAVPCSLQCPHSQCPLQFAWARLGQIEGNANRALQVHQVTVNCPKAPKVGIRG